MYIVIYIASLIIVFGMIETITVTDTKRATYAQLIFMLIFAPAVSLYAIGKVLGKQFKI